MPQEEILWGKLWVRPGLSKQEVGCPSLFFAGIAMPTLPEVQNGKEGSLPPNVLEQRCRERGALCKERGALCRRMRGGRGSPVEQVQVSGSMSAETRLEEVTRRIGFSGLQQVARLL